MAEDESNLPEELQDWSLFEEKGAEIVYVGDHHPGYEHNPHHDPKTGQFTSGPGGQAGAGEEGKRPEEGSRRPEEGSKRPENVGGGKNVAKVQVAVDALPKEHLEEIGEWEAELERLVWKVKENHPNASEDTIREMLKAAGA